MFGSAKEVKTRLGHEADLTSHTYVRNWAAAGAPRKTDYAVPDTEGYGILQLGRGGDVAETQAKVAIEAPRDVLQLGSGCEAAETAVLLVPTAKGDGASIGQRL